MGIVLVWVRAFLSFFLRFLLLKPLRREAVSSKIKWSVLRFHKCCTCSSFQPSYLKSDPEGVCLSLPVCPSPSCKRTMLPHSPAERLCNVLSKSISLFHAALSLHSGGWWAQSWRVPGDKYVAIIPLFSLSVLEETTLIRYCFPSYCELLLILQKNLIPLFVQAF